MCIRDRINAPHPEYEIVSDRWEHPYTREKAAYPIESVRENKFWINVARVDRDVYKSQVQTISVQCKVSTAGKSRKQLSANGV